MTNSRQYSRKGNCPDCGVNSGSRHKQTCPWAYVPEPNSKVLKRIPVATKLKIIIEVLKR